MSSTLISGGIAGLFVIAAATGVNVTMTQAQADQLQEGAFTINATKDIQNCQMELIADAAFTRGIHTQDSASAAVTDCVVSEGTVLTVQVNANGRDFAITATSAGAPNSIVVSDTAGGGSVRAIEKGA